MEYYPVTMYNWDGRFIVCGSKAHREALGKGWYETAALAMQAHRDAEAEMLAASQQIPEPKQRARSREN